MRDLPQSIKPYYGFDPSLHLALDGRHVGEVRSTSPFVDNRKTVKLSEAGVLWARRLMADREHFRRYWTISERADA